MIVSGFPFSTPPIAPSRMDFLNFESPKLATIAVSGSIHSKESEMSSSFQVEFKKKLHEFFEVRERICDADFLVLFNHNEKMIKNYRALGHNKENVILIRTEPFSVFPAQYKPRVENMYSLIISPGNVSSNGSAKSRINWPYTYLPNPLVPVERSESIGELVKSESLRSLFDYEKWSQRNIPISLVASNKYSPIKGSNYEFRRYYAKNSNTEILKVYGTNWNRDFFSSFISRLKVIYFSLKNYYVPTNLSVFSGIFEKYPTYVDTVENKHSIVQASKFSLVIENDDNYISEKLLDAVVGGSIPLYIGPRINAQIFPVDLVLQINPGEDLTLKMEKMTESKVRDWQETALKFLKSEGFTQNYTEEAVHKRIVGLIRDHIQGV